MRHIRHNIVLIGVLVGCLIAGCHARQSSHVMQLNVSEAWPEPWHEFASLLGQPIDSPAVQAFVQRHGLKKYHKGDTGGFDNLDTGGIALVYNKDRVNRVVVRVSYPDNLPSRPALHEGALPFGLTRQDSPEDVIRKVGKPTHQPERDYVVYANRGLTINCNRQQHIIETIYLDAPR